MKLKLSKDKDQGGGTPSEPPKTPGISRGFNLGKGKDQPPAPPTALPVAPPASRGFNLGKGKGETVEAETASSSPPPVSRFSLKKRRDAADGATEADATDAPSGTASAETGGDQAARALVGEGRSFGSVCIARDDRRAVAACSDHCARLIDLAEGRVLLVLKGHTDTLVRVALSCDGRRILTASKDRSARLWDAVTGAELGRLDRHSDALVDAGFSPDDRLILTASADGGVHLWDSQTGAPVGSHRFSGRPTAARFSPDGRSIAVAFREGVARVVDGPAFSEKLVLEGHTDSIRDVEFSRDGSKIVTASADQTARVWDRATGALVQALGGATSALNSASFSPDGAAVVAGLEHGGVLGWLVSTAAMLFSFDRSGGPVGAVAFMAYQRSIVLASAFEPALVLGVSPEPGIPAPRTPSLPRLTPALNSVVPPPPAPRVSGVSDPPAVALAMPVALDSLQSGPPSTVVGRGMRRGESEVDFDTPEAIAHAHWPCAAQASSSYGGSWSPSAMIGPPRVFPRYGDIAGAWAPAPHQSPVDWVDLRFNTFHDLVRAVRVFETNQAGSTFAVVDRTEGDVLLYAGPPTVESSARVLEIVVDPPRPIRNLRVYIVNRGWSELDTVSLITVEPIHPTMRIPIVARSRGGSQGQDVFSGLVAAVQSSLEAVVKAAGQKGSTPLGDPTKLIRDEASAAVAKVSAKWKGVGSLQKAFMGLGLGALVLLEMSVFTRFMRSSNTSAELSPPAGPGAPNPWSEKATSHRGSNGSSFTQVCPPNGTLASVWGTDVYTDDSSICSAAVHVGQITLAQGGSVTVFVHPGRPAYVGSARSGVTTMSFGVFSGSFAFASSVGPVVRAPEGVEAITWAANATRFRPMERSRQEVWCPPSGTPGTVWGRDPFTDDSSICTAAVFAGRITFEQGGVVRLRPKPGRAHYEGDTRNGVTTHDYAVFPGSFSITH